MEPKIFWSAISGRGRTFKVRALILMGDWCGEEKLPTPPERNTGKGEEQALTEGVLDTAVPSARKRFFPCHRKAFSLDRGPFNG
jgi:hypothetical protein